MDNFIKAIKDEVNETFTENGALAYQSTNSSLLDLFGTIGALRTRTDKEIIDKFTKAFSEDKLLATKMMFYARNVRGGLGERRTFRILINYMAKYHTDIMEKNIYLIPFFGRWDDLFSLIGTPLEGKMFEIIEDQIKTDLENLENGKEISLLAKWLKSTSKVSVNSKKIGRLTAKKLHMSYKTYRQILSKLRDRLNIAERNMSLNEWEKIVYSQVPSLAMKKYKNAFRKHNLINFQNYIERVKKGEEKINAKTLYPYDLIEAGGLTESRFDDESDYYCHYDLRNYDEVIEQQWKSLPNYVEGENNVLVMADTSASMHGRPICTSIGLALYFAERNKGPWHNHFLTFSSKPSFIELKGTNLKEKICCIPDICENTDIEKAFELVLKIAVENNLLQEDMPKSIIIISDMEFDRGTSTYGAKKPHNKIMDEMAQMFANNGYTLPKIIYWNVDSRQDIYHAVCENKNVSMVSGQSVSTFKTVLMSIDETPYDTMLKTLNDKMYEIVRI